MGTEKKVQMESIFRKSQVLVASEYFRAHAGPENIFKHIFELSIFGDW